MIVSRPSTLHNFGDRLADSIDIGAVQSGDIDAAGCQSIDTVLILESIYLFAIQLDQGPREHGRGVFVGQDVDLRAGKSVDLPVPDGHTTTFLVLSGEVTVNGERAAGEGDLVIFERSGAGIALHANSDAKLLVMDGEPIDEPIVGQGPFVMNSRTEIQQAIED